jgi:class 3 adenylate cyclase
MTARILVVDDVPKNVRLLEAILASEGYSVSAAASGREALEQLTVDPPDLVLLDIQMPGMNGYEVCRRIRENAATTFLPVVMVTSSDSEVRVNTIEAQAAELAEWNETLERRVDEQVDELQRMSSLRRFLSPTLAEVVLTQGESVLENHRREIAVLFADLRGWTSFSASTEPEEVMSVIQSFHTAVGELVLRFEATVGWFAGDGLMVWFNDPLPCADAPARAVSMAVEIRSAMGELKAAWRKRGHELDFSVGIALGYATLGKIGFDGRYDYGAVGSVLNLASRLCDEALPGQIVVSERVLSEVDELVEVEPVGELTLKGFMKPVAGFNVLSVRPAERATQSSP